MNRDLTKAASSQNSVTKLGLKPMAGNQAKLF